MRPDTLGILRCPYCGGRVEPSAQSPRHTRGAETTDAVLQCACRSFPLVAGIPVMQSGTAADAACAHLRANQPDLACRALLRLDDERLTCFERLASSKTATYGQTVEALDLGLESSYFLYRFSDPSYVVADQLVRAVAGTVLRGGGRAIDLCGGSGHLTRSLATLSTDPVREPPVLADLSGWPVGSLHPTARRSAATATPHFRSRAAPSGSRCARTPSCSSGPSGSS
jgi:uncharacterized protein YbaR (Trm112 family)